MVVALREALVAGDVDRAQQHRWLQPRPPGERDLLSDLAAAEGIAPAVQRLSRFWKRAEVRLEQVRAIDGLEAEVYERLILPGENLPIVSLVRRDSERKPWRVVCTNETRDERFTIWVAVEADAIDDAAWTRAFAEPGELLMTDTGGVLGHPDRGWLVHVRGPHVPDAWPENLSGEGGKIVELGTALSPAPGERQAQLRWVLAAAATMLEQLQGTAAYRPAEGKLVLPPVLERVASGQMAPAQSFHFWARVFDLDGYVVTEGLHVLGLPELEAPADLRGDPASTRRLVEWLATSMTAASQMPALGTELVMGDETAILEVGRRGPRRGTSYGRWGAYRLAATSGSGKRGSRTRMRVPDEVYA